MESQEILKYCLRKGFLLDEEILKLFNESLDFETSKIVIERINQYTKRKIITKSVLNENKDKLSKIFSDIPFNNKNLMETLKIKLGLSIEISKEVGVISEREVKSSPSQMSSFSEDVKIISMIPSISKKIEVKDFVTHFRNRFVELRKILQENSQLSNLVSINKIFGDKQGISLIGMVKSKRTTSNGNIIFEIEDLTGTIRILVNKNKPELFEKAELITLDSVMGFKGSGNKEIVYINDIIFPETILFERKKSPEEEYILFTGDVHIGSKLFLEENFLKFIDYLNGKVPDTPEVSKIKYLFIVGDLVAGVGVYPGQEKELTILDVEEQYQKAAELLKKIRSDIKIILSPGNHDALRIMEPQPLLDEKYAWPIYELKNIILTGNPALINLGSKKDFSGFNVLTYHGFSYHYYANNISYLAKEKATRKPEMIMAYLLKNRHLAPTHASSLYFPSEEDSLLIKEIPDIFLSGHTHKSGVQYYNGVLIISSSSWESKTAYEEKMGNEPDFCKVPMFNTKTRAIKILDFE